jgi:long-chain acyl-CoA synthetase
MTYSYFCDVDSVPANGALLHAAPLSHGSGLYNFTHLARGAAQVVPESDGFDAAEIARLLATHREASFFAAPTMVKRLVDAAIEPGGLRTLVYGGGPMYHADLVAAMERLGNRLVQIYGQGESPMTITALSNSTMATSRIRGTWSASRRWARRTAWSKSRSATRRGARRRRARRARSACAATS